MFTGIIEALGTVKSIKQMEVPGPQSIDNPPRRVVTIGDASSVLDNCRIGDRINVNGVCFKIAEFDETSLQVNVDISLYWASNFRHVVPGTKVTLERPVSGTSRFGGHFVQGRVDKVASIVTMDSNNGALHVQFEFQARENDIEGLNIMRGGFIAVNGVSATVERDWPENQFSIVLKDYASEKFAFRNSNAGDIVNVELDLNAKLVSRQVESYVNSTIKGLVDDQLYNQVDDVLEDMLKERIASEFEYHLSVRCEELIPELVREVKLKAQKQLDN